MNQQASQSMPVARLFEGIYEYWCGPWRVERHCRVVIAGVSQKLVAAQLCNGDELSSAEKEGLADSLFTVDEVDQSPEEWSLSPIDQLPQWAVPLAMRHVSESDVAEAKSAGFLIHKGSASDGHDLLGRWWWTLSQPGWTGVEASHGAYDSELAAWADAVLALRTDPELAHTLPQEQVALPEVEAVLVQAIEASGFSVSGPTDSRAAEHGEPAWVCNARGALARANATRIDLKMLSEPEKLPQMQRQTAAHRVWVSGLKAGDRVEVPYSLASEDIKPMTVLNNDGAWLRLLPDGYGNTAENTVLADAVSGNLRYGGARIVPLGTANRIAERIKLSPRP
ncbi:MULTISPECIES: hypothetical protein [Cupriavidus]|uniref:hypothetical protein n=1 Tax=Cupriavidus TaxID=106589 RepID=UPI0011EEB3A1|nr:MULTISPECIES: hypothetical protein [Cupriavidus]MWL91808.1 hypothetical protein [Cupriavidus sp. SW-Y-13]